MAMRGAKKSGEQRQTSGEQTGEQRANKIANLLLSNELRGRIKKARQGVGKHDRGVLERGVLQSKQRNGAEAGPSLNNPEASKSDAMKPAAPESRQVGTCRTRTEPEQAPEQSPNKAPNMLI